MLAIVHKSSFVSKKTSYILEYGCCLQCPEYLYPFLESMDIPIKLDTVTSGWSIVLRGYTKNVIIYHSLKINFLSKT